MTIDEVAPAVVHVMTIFSRLGRPTDDSDHSANRIGTNTNKSVCYVQPTHNLDSSGRRDVAYGHPVPSGARG